MVSVGLFLESSDPRSLQIESFKRFSQQLKFSIMKKSLPGGLVEHTKHPLISPIGVAGIASPIEKFEKELSQRNKELVNFWWYNNQDRLREYQRLLKIKERRSVTKEQIVIEILDREEEIAQIKQRAEKQCSPEQFPLRWNESLRASLEKADKKMKVAQHFRDPLRREIATFGGLQSDWNSKLN